MLRLSRTAQPRALFELQLSFVCQRCAQATRRQTKITRIEETIEQPMRPFQNAVNPWLTVPGSKHRLAWTLVAEVGPTVAAFPSAADLVSWGRRLPRPQQDRWQREERHDARGESLAAESVVRSCLGRLQEQGDLPAGAVSAPGGSAPS